MNKIIIAGVACLLGLGAVSCGDTKDTTLNIQYGSYYHVSRIDGLGSPAISAGSLYNERLLIQCKTKHAAFSRQRHAGT